MIQWPAHGVELISTRYQYLGTLTLAFIHTPPYTQLTNVGHHQTTLLHIFKKKSKTKKQAWNMWWQSRNIAKIMWKRSPVHILGPPWVNQVCVYLWSNLAEAGDEQWYGNPVGCALSLCLSLIEGPNIQTFFKIKKQNSRPSTRILFCVCLLLLLFFVLFLVFCFYSPCRDLILPQDILPGRITSSTP